MIQFNRLTVSVWDTIIYTIIVLGNIVTIGSPLNLIISVPEILFVIYLMFTNRVSKATFYHLVFVITCISATGAMGMSEDAMTIYSYSRLKLFGPVGFSYVIAILLLLFSLNKRTMMPKQTLFYKLFKTLFFLSVSGFIMGLLGFMFDDHYSIEGILNYGVYIAIILVNIYTLINNYTEELVRFFFKSVIPLLSASIYASFIAYYGLQISTTYGGLSNIILKPDLTYYSPMLLLVFFLVKNRINCILPLGCLLIMNFNSSGGKEVIILGLSVLVFIITDILGSGRKILSFRYQVVTILLLLVIFIGFTQTSSESLFSRKVYEFTSIFSSDISNVNTSPYIRISSTIDIFYGYLLHPYLLLFGSGYGGYFVDHLNLFAKISLGHSSFSTADINSGYFHTAHDTFATVPLLNGVVGFVLIMFLNIKYIKRIKNNYCAFAAIPWLLLTFYFNSQLGLTGMFLLYASEYPLKSNINNSPSVIVTKNSK